MESAGWAHENIPGTGVGTGSVSVSALQQALTSGQLTSAALTRFYLGRIERINPQLRAVIEVSPDAAEAAAASDQARAAGTGAAGPLAGIPVLIKDNIAVAGQPATAGSPALAGTETGDAFLVGRLRQAGAIVLGKANLSEWANFRSTRSSSGWSTLGGQAVNPHGTGRNPSGSSSGSAVAVAGGLAPLSIGTETDGSIVSPASACGIVGLKPTLGLVSRSGIVPITPEQDTAGPMTACVADAAALLDAIVGADPSDEATQAPVPSPGPGGYAGLLDPGALDGARIGVWRDGSAAAGPASVAVLDAAIARLRACGARVTDPVELPDYAKIGEPEFACLLHEFKVYLNKYLAAAPGEHPGSLAELIAYNSKHAATVQAVFGQELFEQSEATSGDLADAAYQAARADARRIARAALDSALVGVGLDAVVALSSSPAWLTDHILGDHHVFGTAGPPAVAGYPSITVPAGWVSGLPVGVTFMGPAWNEAQLLALAYAFEQSAG